MQIFDLHFNPKAREDCFFNSFVYEPEHIYEKKLGGLYITGELKNALPQNIRFLDNVARAIKGRYYNLSFKTPERAISEGLKKSNEFFQEEVKKDNVSWLGNLNLSVLSLKDSHLIFTKTGDLKILLLRGGQITDIGKNLDLQEIDPYPLKVFLSVVSGKLALNDIVLVQSKEIYDFFCKEKIMDKLRLIENFDEKKLKEVLPPSLFEKRDGAENVSGLCLLLYLGKEISAKKPKEILFEKEKSFSFSEILSPITRPLGKIKKKLLFFRKFNKNDKKIKKQKKSPAAKKYLCYRSKTPRLRKAKKSIL